MAEKTTRITKPAGCALQALGFLLLLIAAPMVIRSATAPAWAIADLVGPGLAAIGIWLVILGRRPAVRRRFSDPGRP